MGIPFLSGDDARSRLNNTICMYKGKPVYVARADHRDVIQIAPMRVNHTRDDWQQVAIADTDFSYKSVPLGYMYLEGQAYYVMRIPYRQTKAGLGMDCIATEPPIDPHAFFVTKAFESCILGKHDDLTGALKKIELGKARSVPIHRHVAIVRNKTKELELHYRGRLVGYYSIEHKRFHINDGPDYSFIHRILNNLGIPGI